MNIAAAILKAPIHVYRWTLKPLIGMECRHLPTCSEYALEAIDTNGAWRGFWLAASRLSRCHPWGSHGYDPVPDITAERHPFAPWRYGRWKKPLDAKQTEMTALDLHVFVSADGARRVHIFRDSNGRYGFSEEILREEELPYSSTPDGEPETTTYWLPCDDDSKAVCDSEETALREAAGRIPWLKAQLPGE